MDICKIPQLFGLSEAEKLSELNAGHIIRTFLAVCGGKKYVLIGDEFYSPRCITENRQAGMPFNPEANRRFLDELRGGDFTPVVFHDPDLVPGALGTRQIF